MTPQFKKIANGITLTRRNLLVWQPQQKFYVTKEVKAQNVGVVIKTHPSCITISQNDVIFYGQFGGVYVDVYGERLVLISENEVFGKILNREIPLLTDFEIGETYDFQKYFDQLAADIGALKTQRCLNIRLS